MKVVITVCPMHKVKLVKTFGWLVLGLASFPIYGHRAGSVLQTFLDGEEIEHCGIGGFYIGCYIQGAAYTDSEDLGEPR
jgi:hypothetical protein